jgi:hypothetical protein
MHESLIIFTKSIQRINLLMVDRLEKRLPLFV